MPSTWSWRTERFTLIVSVAFVGQAELQAPELLAGLLEHPLPERDDQAGVLGERDEHVRRQHALHGVVPADERLDAGDAAGLERDDRLVEQTELVRSRCRGRGRP